MHRCVFKIRWCECSSVVSGDGKEKLHNTSKLHFLNIPFVYACSTINSYSQGAISSLTGPALPAYKTQMKQREGRICV